MSQIPDDILETLICTECACYLSYGPIRLKIEGGSVCGRCLLPDNSYVTDTPYENLAKMMNFPCRYKIDGCKHEAKFGEVKTHEDECEYRKCFCPVISDGSCEWKGSLKQILEHVEGDHNDKLLTHPCVVPHSFTENLTTIYITSISDFLFLIYLESSASTRKIRQWVKILAAKEYAQRFEFSLSIESPDKKNIEQTNRVLPFVSDSDDALVTYVSVLQEFFGTLEDIKFVVTINILGNEECLLCQGFIKKFVHQHLENFKCEKCLPALTSCGSCSKYRDFETKLDKHHLYFCYEANMCTINIHVENPIHDFNCGYCTPTAYVSTFEEYNDKNLQGHNHKENRYIYHNSNTFKAIGTSPKTHILKTEIGQIVCEHKAFYNRFNVDIYSPLTDNELNNYDCYLQIHNPDNIYKFEGFLKRENGLEPDWTLQIENLKDIVFEIELEFKVTFPKRDIYKHPQLR